MTLTRAMAWAAATDAGNRNMRAHGRAVWDESDYNAAAAEFERLWPVEREIITETAEQCACMVDACVETHPSQIGPFYSQGWNKALRTAAERIRAAYK